MARRRSDDRFDPKGAQLAGGVGAAAEAVDAIAARHERFRHGPADKSGVAGQEYGRHKPVPTTSIRSGSLDRIMSGRARTVPLWDPVWRVSRGPPS